MKRSRNTSLVITLTALAMGLALGFTDLGAARAHDNKGGHDRHKAEMATSRPQPGELAKVKLVDLEVTNQAGRSAKFKSEVIGDRIVVMDFIYTTCTTICPVLTAIMGQVQQRLGERLGKDVFINSVTVDPVNDTPQRLKAYAQRHKSRWDFWTGQKPTVDKILGGLGAYTPDFTDHPSLVLVGDAKSGEWTRFFGFASPEQIVARVEQLLAARHNAMSRAGGRQ